MENTQAYKILNFIRSNYKRNELDILEEFIQTEFPESWERFQSDNYDGGKDIDYNAPDENERAWQRAQSQKLK